MVYTAQKVQKYALDSQLQALQILTNDDEVQNWSLSSFLLAVLNPDFFFNIQQLRFLQYELKHIFDMNYKDDFATKLIISDEWYQKAFWIGCISSTVELNTQ